jgi:CRP-like cAMP-binding protein
LLGETAMMTATTRPATATALEPSTVVRISRALFLKMLEGYPDAARRLRDIMADRSDLWAQEMNNVRAILGKRESR